MEGYAFILKSAMKIRTFNEKVKAVLVEGRDKFPYHPKLKELIKNYEEMEVTDDPDEYL